MKTSIMTALAIHVWSVGVNIDLAHDVEMYLQVIVYHKYKMDKHIYIDMFIMISKNLRYMCRTVLK